MLRVKVVIHYSRVYEIPVEKLNALRHSGWNASENIGWDLRPCNSSATFGKFS